MLILQYYLSTRYDARFLEKFQVMKLRLSYVTHLLTCRDRPTDRLNDLMIDCFIDWLIDFPLRNTTPTPQKYMPTILSSFLLFLSRSSRSVLRLLLLSSPVEQRGNQKWSRVHKEAGAYDTMQLWKSMPYVRLAEETISRKLVSSFVYLT